jgi:hypothetical protein
MEYDRENGNTRWRVSEIMEVEQLHEYSVFGDKGYGGSKPTSYKMIRCHLVYNVKHDARHKSHLVARGHLTDTPLTTGHRVFWSSFTMVGLNDCVPCQT